MLAITSQKVCHFPDGIKEYRHHLVTAGNKRSIADTMVAAIRSRINSFK